MIRLVIAEDQTMVLGALAKLLALEEDIEVVATAIDGTAALAAVRSNQATREGTASAPLTSLTRAKAASMRRRGSPGERPQARGRLG